MADMINYEKMKNRCTNYDKEIECCRILSDWSEAMPVLQPCIESPCKYFKPYTNYDRIKQMSVEDVAYRLMCPYETDPDICNEDDCIKCTKEWLEHEVEE